jgi:hypothetical protein
MSLTEGNERLFVANGSAMFERVTQGQWMTLSSRDQGNVASGVYNLSGAEPARTTGASARYEGTIVHYDKSGDAYQSVDGGLVKHSREAFSGSKSPAIGSTPKIQYLRGRAMVAGLEHDQER